MVEYLSALWHFWIVIVIGGSIALIDTVLVVREATQVWPRLRKHLFVILTSTLIVAQVLAWCSMKKDRDECQQQSENETQRAIREGRYYPPKIYVKFDGKTCSVRNIDAFDLIEPEIYFLVHRVNIASCEPLSGIHNLVPNVHAQVLQPQEVLWAIFGDDERTHLCSQYYNDPSGSKYDLPEANIANALECRVVVHRAADRKKYIAREYAFISPPNLGCNIHLSSYTPITINDPKTGKFHIEREYHDKRDGDTYSCLLKIDSDPGWKKLRSFPERLMEHELEEVPN